jgi:hypothetical protein
VTEILSTPSIVNGESTESLARKSLTVNYITVDWCSTFVPKRKLGNAQRVVREFEANQGYNPRVLVTSARSSPLVFLQPLTVQPLAKLAPPQPRQ